MNEKMNNSYSLKTIISPLAIIVSLIAILAGLLMLIVTKQQSVYGVTIILPFWFSFLCFISGTLFKHLFKSPVSILIVGGYLIRMVMQPLLFCIGGNVSFYHCEISTFNMIKSVLLLCLENTSVFLVANICSKRSISNQSKSIIQPEMYNTRIVGWTVFLLGLFLIYAYNTIPSLKNIYMFLPTADFSQLAYIRWDNETIVARGSVLRYVYSLFTFIWPIVRAILPAFCISQIYLKHGSSRISIVLSLFCLIIPSVFLGGDNIAPFLGALYGILVMHRLYGKKMNKTIFIICFVFGIAFCYILSQKITEFQNWRGASGISSISQVINAYFPGFENIAVSFSVEDHNKISTLFFDFYYAIPFKESIFGLRGDTFSDLYNQTSQTSGQILPWGAQIAHYFTILGSPIITGLLVLYSYRCEIISNETNDFWMYYRKLYISVLTALSIHIYSFSIYFRYYLNVLLPIIIIIFFGNRKKYFKSKPST